MVQFGKKAFWGDILIALVIAFIVFMNLHLHKTIMGLDNISPWFNTDVNFFRNFRSDNFFLYGPQFFNIPLVLINFFKLPSWFGSQLFLWFSFSFGILLYFKCFYVLFGSKISIPMKLTILFMIVGSLVTIWLFNQPNFIFLCMFAGFPTLLYFLLVKDLKKDISAMSWIGVIIGISYFYTTSLNIVTFLLGISQLFILGVLLSSVFKDENLKDQFKRVCVRLGFVIIVWFLFAQALILFTPNKNFIGSEMVDLLKTINENPITKIITKDLRESEIRNNSIVNSVRFATGWMEFHDLNNKPVFKYYDLYMSSTLFIIIGLLPFAVIVGRAPAVVKANKKFLWLFVVYVIVIFMMSRYFSMVTGQLSFVSEATRWLSSKLWQTLLFLTPILFLFSIKDLDKKLKSGLVLIMSLVLVVYSFPWLSGNILSGSVVVDLPSEYSYFSKLGSSDKVLYSPGPQSAYFRQYDWGYYGSDFFAYMTKAEVVDVSSVSKYRNDYDSYLEAVHSCDVKVLRKEGLDYYVFDNSVVDSDNIVPPKNCNSFKKVEENRYFIVWEIKAR